MSLNSPDSNTNSSWSNDQQTQQAQDQSTSYVGGTVSAGLAQLFGLASMTADNRNVKEVGETREVLQKIYDDLKKSTTSEIQQAIIPTIEVLTSSVSPQLPGLGFYAKFGDTLYIAAALFYNRNISIGSERVNITTGVNMAQSLSIPLTPAQAAAQGAFVSKLKEHYQRVAETKQAKHVNIINILAVDLEMLAHPEAGESKDYPQHIASHLATEWEEAIMVKTASEMTMMNRQIPSPFITKDTPYGKENCAEARVSAVSGRVNKAKHLTSANIEVIVNTINNPANPSAFQANSREVARATASVSLIGVTWDEHMKMLQTQNNQNNIMIQNLMGIGQSPYPSGYRPLRPVISLDTAQPGEMMGNNGGLHSYLFGLYTLLATNTQYVFMEGLRKPNVGARGNLSSLEIRIEQLLKSVQGLPIPNRIKLDDKTIHDTDVVNAWIRQNVSPHAVFQAVINPAGANSAINNYLARLMDTSNNVNEMKTLVAVMDSLSGCRFSKLLEENQKLNNGQGWNMTKPALIPTGIIGINGLATLGDRKLNPLELDEMMACTIKGKNIAAIESLLSTMYGTVQGESLKQRTQKLRVEAASSIFDGALHINNFSVSAIWHPELMALIGKSMDGIGQLHVANNLGSWRSNQVVFAPGVNLATQVAAGSNIGNGLAGGLGFATFG